MKVNVEEMDTIIYDIALDEYGIKVPEDNSSYILLKYCPWCAKKLPKSKRKKWVDELEKLGFDSPFVQKDIIPEEYKSDQWRSK